MYLLKKEWGGVMSIKHILVPLEGQESDQCVLETAFRIGKKFGAHIEALEVMLDGRDAVPFIGQGLSAPVVEQIISSLETESQDLRNKAFSFFEAWHKKHDEFAQGKMTNSWSEVLGRSSEVVPEKARVSDLVVLSRLSAIGDDLSVAMCESTLMEGGCPVLFSIDPIPQHIGKNVTFFWNGSLECARALHLALPFLHKAEKITILTTSKSDTMGESGASVQSYLAYHKLSSDLVDLECGKDKIGEAVMTRSYDLNADLFIMGAYTHSRLREWVLGSITRHVLGTSKIPALLIH